MKKSLLKRIGGDQTYEVRLESQSSEHGSRYVLHVDAKATELEIVEGGGGVGIIRSAGCSRRFYASRKDNRIDVWLDGRVYSFESMEVAARRAASGEAAAGTGANAISAPMPGTILKILATAGDAVEAHQALVVMESMKMEMTLSAPSAGRVKDVLCSVGELVEMGKVLMKLEPPSDG
ncbi:MAG: hypothetical protein KF841_07630 [Phycisphaerae bacterium]|nr:hypothetical protein [Phycisphaerae bacterium]